jgi:hypothetical protein
VPSKPVVNVEPIDELAGKLKRTEIQHRSLSIAGREVVQVLTEIPCGVESGWHISTRGKRLATSLPVRCE